MLDVLVGWFYGYVQQYLSFIVVVDFIDGGNRSTRRKPPTVRHRQTLSHNVVHLFMSGIRTHNNICIGPSYDETEILRRD